jgi:hypothetical protein
MKHNYVDAGEGTVWIVNLDVLLWALGQKDVVTTSYLTKPDDHTKRAFLSTWLERDKADIIGKHSKLLPGTEKL